MSWIITVHKTNGTDKCGSCEKITAKEAQIYV
jgi:hypothetical protein